MIESPRIVQVEQVLTAAIHLTVPRSQIQQVMGPAIAEVMGVVAAQGAGPAGPWLTHHLRMDPVTFDLEVCVPVTRPVEPAGRVVPSSLPAARVAQAVYCGPYEGLGAAWGEFRAWITAQGLTPGPSLWEVYQVNPANSVDPATWRTVLHQPLEG